MTAPCGIARPRGSGGSARCSRGPDSRNTPRSIADLQAALDPVPGRCAPPVVTSEAPEHADGSPSAARGEAAVLAALVMEPAQADKVGRAVVATPRAVAQVVALEIAARGAAGRHAAPAVTHVDFVARAPRHPIFVVPRVYEILDERQQPDPGRHAAAADGKHPGCEPGRGGIGRVGYGVRVGIPRNRAGGCGEARTLGVDGGEEL